VHPLFNPLLVLIDLPSTLEYNLIANPFLQADPRRKLLPLKQFHPPLDAALASRHLSGQHNGIPQSPRKINQDPRPGALRPPKHAPRKAQLLKRNE
jgi:hypothetical protein